MQFKVLIVSPAFPPSINGLGDYSYILGKELAKNSNLEIIYAGLRQPQIPNIAPYHEINSTNTVQKISSHERIDIIFLNYVNYAYHKRGIPYWLLSDLKTASKNTRLITFFHEVFATGQIWQSSYWLHLMQKQIFRNLYQISSRSFCSNDIVLEIVKKTTPDYGTKIENIGIFSNIPEPPKSDNWEKRKNVAVVFGSLGRRNSVYSNLQKIEPILKTFEINKILDIGPGQPDIHHTADVEMIGVKGASEVSKILLQSKFGLISYPNALIGKSGIFAAYASHNLAVVNTEYNKDKNKHYDFFVSNELNLDGLKLVLERTNTWYKQRNLKSHVEHIISTIFKS